MRLRRLDLIRYGHFTDFQLDLGARGASTDFHIILGRNEAGKTTITEAWIDLLYGFPPQTPYSFRHERRALEVSAQIEANSKIWHLTRLPTRENNLVDANRSPVPEERLKDLLTGVGKEAYQNLFCLK